MVVAAVYFLHGKFTESQRKCETRDSFVKHAFARCQSLKLLRCVHDTLRTMKLMHVFNGVNGTATAAMTLTADMHDAADDISSAE